jgi:hypothetical protein
VKFLLRVDFLSSKELTLIRDPLEDVALPKHERVEVRKRAGTARSDHYT